MSENPPLAEQNFTLGAALFGEGTIAELPAIVSTVSSCPAFLASSPALPRRRSAHRPRASDLSGSPDCVRPTVEGRATEVEGRATGTVGALLVTDRGLVAAGISGEVAHLLQAAGIPTAVFDAVHPNPDTETLEQGAQAARDFNPAVVVALGGGSALDAAKGIALMATNDGPAQDFDYRREPARPGLPVVAVPTTAGTGSETNGFGVIEDPVARRKFYAGHDSVVPRRVILDPTLTHVLPPAPTAASGMDVLTHALEALSSRRSNPYAEGISLQVVGMVARYLPQAVGDGGNREARAQMLLAAHLAGLAFATTGLGLVHAVGHALSARLGTAHGVALSAVLPHVLSFNLPVRAETYGRVAWALGIDGVVTAEQPAAHPAIDAVRRLESEVGMGTTLRSLGCSPELLPTLVEAALADEVIANTPRLPSAEELHSLLLDAF